MRLLCVVGILVTTGAWAGICPAPTIKAHALTGMICFESGSQCSPIPGARVQLLETSGVEVTATTADGKGKFRIDAPRSGRFTLKISAEGFHAVEGSLIAGKKGK